VVLAALLAGAAIAAVYVGLPAIAGLDDTLRRVRDGEPAWLALAAGLELCSFAGYVLLVRTVLARGEPRLGWRVCLDVTLAGLAATRLFAAGGAGGVALTAWSLRASGMPAALVVVRMTSFMVLLYGVFMAALLIGGSAIASGTAQTDVPQGLSIVPAAFGLGVIVAALSISRLGGSSPRAPASPEGTAARWARRVSHAAHLLAAGVRDALALARARRPGLLGAPAWWGFDLAVLWACFRAFGEPPPTAVLVTGYFIGMLANTLPLPGGIGGVDVGMVGAFIAYGVEPGLAVVAVIAYRAFAFWLPTLPGAIAYVRLRRDVHRWRESDATADVSRSSRDAARTALR
jgi:uncharacterized protein (TIRG00374 family)